MASKKKLAGTKKKKVISKDIEPKKKPLIITEFYIWCKKRGISQIDIKRATGNSLGSVHNMWHVGKSNVSTIRLLSYVFSDKKRFKNAKVTEDEVKKMITTSIFSGE